MQVPLKIDFHGMEPSPFIERRIKERVAKLLRFHDRMIGCRVVVEAPHRRHRRGNSYQIHIAVQMPGAMLSINRHPGQAPAHTDVYVALRDSFDAVERRLNEYGQRPLLARVAAMGGRRS